MAIPQVVSPGYMNQRKRAQEEQVENRKQREFTSKERQKAAMRNFGLGLAQSVIGGIFKELLDVGGEELREAVSGKRRALKGMSGDAARQYYMNQTQKGPDVNSAIMGALDLGEFNKSLGTMGAGLSAGKQEMVEMGFNPVTPQRLKSFDGIGNRAIPEGRFFPEDRF